VSKTIKYDALLDLTQRILEKGYGYSAREAAITAKVLVEADARGIPSHVVSRLDFYRKNIQGGFAKPGAQPEVVFETPVSLVVDGRDGIGPFITEFTVNRMLEKAKAGGVGFASVRNSNHFGIAGYWAERAAMQGMMGMAYTNTRACGIPTFGKERVLGTNPIAWAIPEADVPGDGSGIFMIDIATTTVAHGKVEVYDRRKKPMPAGWAVDDNGRTTTDATAFENLFQTNPLLGGHLFLGGEGDETGGHKGYGLGLLVELLCSGLSLGAASSHTFEKGKGSGITHFFGAISLNIFGNGEAITAHVKEILDEIRGGAKASGQDRIFTHGQKEAEARAAALKNGIYIDDATEKLLSDLEAEIK
jgi:LDH2 family malate/lactate/ureidoglycolate dehydrogenase